MYRSYAELTAEAARCGGSLAKAVLENEMQLTERSETQVYAELRRRWQVMCDAAHGALDAPMEMPGGLIAGQASRQRAYAEQGAGFAGAVLNQAMALALSASEVNAAMGRVCAAPTAGACGVLPAVLLAAGAHCAELSRSESEPDAPRAAPRRASGGCEAAAAGDKVTDIAIDDTEILDALLVAGGVGALITRNATVSGAEGGCQAECGAAAAMAAAAVVHLAGGSAEQAGNAVSIALMNCMGLVCDPVAGLVQLPCSFRNASQTANALLSADLALAGQGAVIPPDEAIEAMLRVGRSLPQTLRETAQGGVAASPTGRKIKKDLGENA